MSELRDFVFAFGPDGKHIYAGGDSKYCRNVPRDVKDILEVFDGVVWASFGANEDSCVGRKIPCALKSYLYNAKGELIGRPNLKVVFGPGNSFFAWDDHSVRWHKIPERMESVVQGWMTTTGWRHGLPKIVALGTDDLYFILTEENVASYWVPPHHAKTRRAMMRWEQDKYHNLSSVTFNAFLDDNHIIVSGDGRWDIDLPDSTDLPRVRQMLEPASRAWARTQQEERERQEEEERQERLRQEQEERERMNCEQEEARRKEEEKLQQDDKARREWRRAEESAREARKREQEICHHMPLYFQKWHQRWTAAFAEGSITVFPHPPQFVCICKEVSCVVQKNEQGALLACRPDMKRLLEASGPYSSRWLRQESLNFHPDRFALKCDKDYRPELRPKATAMFQIIRDLMEEEQKVEV